MTPGEARALFPGLGDKTFLDAACVSLAPRPAADAVQRFLDMALHGPALDASRHHIAMDDLVASARREAARLLRCPVAHVAIVESTTQGLNFAARAVPMSAGDAVLVADTEFLQVAIPWSARAAREGIVVRPVRSRAGALDADDFARAMDARTRAVCVSSVQWATGCRVDLAGLGALCRDRGVWLVVDAIQEMGALAIDLSAGGSDFVVAGGHKWLNAPFGCGVMYVSDRALAELEPSSWGYLALEAPAGGWQAYFETPSITPFRDYRFPREARRWETAGTTNYPGAAGLGASIAIANAIGIDAIEAHVLRLAALAREELRRAGAHLVSPEPESMRSGITVFRVSDDPRHDRAVMEALLAERIHVALRYTGGLGGIRVSTHYFNEEDDVRRLAAAVSRGARA
jgi:selenocysteine lyase/cysteine desulfurase